jgi:hypothetical protein
MTEKFDPSRAAYEAYGEGEYGFGPFADLPEDAKQRWQKVANAVGALPAPEQILTWECFCDAAYFDKWCVRRIGDTTFGDGFHLDAYDEAKVLVDLLNAHPFPSPSGAKAVADDLWQELLDKNDRTSPDEYPDMALITREELADFIARSSAGTGANAVAEAARNFADLFIADSVDPPALTTEVDPNELANRYEALSVALAHPLPAEVGRVLRPFADMAGEMFSRGWDKTNVAIALDNPDDPHRVTASDFFAARALLIKLEAGR